MRKQPVIQWFLGLLTIGVFLQTNIWAAEESRNVSPAAKIAQAIDREIFKKLEGSGIKVSPLADDAEFLRRAALDITGRIPTAERAAAFLASTDPDKRSKLIDDLLANSFYGENFAGIWTDLINATGTPPKSATGVFRKWLAEELNTGRGWDKTVHEMLTSVGTQYEKPSGYFVRANYKEPGQLAGTTARFFLGVRIECAECHNHPFTQWKQTDYWGLAAFYTRLKQVNVKGGNLLTEDLMGKKPKTPGATVTIPSAGVKNGAGKVVKARFLGGAEPKLSDDGPFRPALADWITSKDNPFFAQAAVNRTWAHLFGSGLFNPIDDYNEDIPPSHPELLKMLAREFIASGHDLKHLIRCIANSQTYQRTSKPLPENKDDVTLFSHMAVKVMTADVLFDSLVTALGNPKLPGGLGSPLPYEIYSGAANKQGKANARDEFLKFFDTKDDSGKTTEYTHGIPQVLALMNAQQFNSTPPIVAQLVKARVAKEKAVETLFLSALTRYPTANEMKLMTGYLDRRQNPELGYTGILWILFNSSEFVLNH